MKITLFFLFTITFIAFIVLWWKKRKARKTTGENYKENDRYILFSRIKKAIGWICIISFIGFLAAPIPPDDLAKIEATRKARIEKEKTAAEAKAEADILANKSKENDNQTITLTANELIDSYEKDLKGANKNYKGKTLQVTGSIRHIKKSGDTISLILGTGDKAGILASTTIAECNNKIGKEPEIGNNITLVSNDVHGGNMEGTILIQLRNCTVADYSGNNDSPSTKVQNSSNSDNPLANQVTTSVRGLKAEGERYNNQVVIIGPLNVGKNDLTYKWFRAYGTNKNGQADIDASIQIQYDNINTINKKSYELTDNDIVFVKGIFVYKDSKHFGSDSIYAQEIIYIGNVDK